MTATTRRTGRLGSDIVVETGLTPAQSEMVAANTGLIGFVLKTKAKHLVGDAYDEADAWQDGVFGLARAVQLFDPTLGYRFSTYALPLIFQSIQRGRGRIESAAWRNAYQAGAARDFEAPLSLDHEYANADGSHGIGDMLPDAHALPESDATAIEAVDRLRAECRDDLDHAVLDAMLTGSQLAQVVERFGCHTWTPTQRAKRLRTIGARLLGAT